MRRIVIPQAFIRMLPGILNQFVICFKSTSIVSIIAVPDLMYQAGLIVSASSCQCRSIRAVAADLFRLSSPCRPRALLFAQAAMGGYFQTQQHAAA